MAGNGNRGGNGGPTPVLVVSGFLGSGKTTLIRRLLAAPGRPLGEVAVVVNEFGAVGIDHHLLTAADERTTLLPGGCVCCGLRDDLADALRDLLARRDRGAVPRFGRVVIETTGLADPAPILRTLVADPVLRHHYRLERLVVALDAPGGAGNLARYGEAVRQVAAADAVVVTKRDLAPPEAADNLAALALRINPTAEIVDAAAGAADLVARLLGGGDRDRNRGGGVHGSLIQGADRVVAPADGVGVALPPSAHAAGRVASRCLVFERPLHWPMFAIWLTLLLHRHGDRVLRVKGLLDAGGGRGPLLLEGVQHVVHAPRHLAAWPDADRRSRLVVIARDLDPARIEESLAAFQAAAS